MTGVAPIRLFATVDASEHGAIAMGAELVRAYLAGARAEAVEPFAISFASAGSLPGPAEPPHLIITSLLTELLDASSMERDASDRWSSYLEHLLECGAPVFLCTIFRHVPGRSASGDPDPRLVRIRELNLLAVELSHSLGVNVIDTDRALANLGGKALQTDHRLGGSRASIAAGHAIAHAVLGYGLDELGDPALQENARNRLGGMDKVPDLILRFERERQTRAKTDG